MYWHRQIPDSFSFLIFFPNKFVLFPFPFYFSLLSPFFCQPIGGGGGVHPRSYATAVRNLFLVCHVHLQVAGHSRGNNEIDDLAMYGILYISYDINVL